MVTIVAGPIIAQSGGSFTPLMISTVAAALIAMAYIISVLKLHVPNKTAQQGKLPVNLLRALVS